MLGLGVAGVVILFGISLNLANLLLVRGTARSTELSVRMSLGASKVHLFGLLAVESAIIVATALVFSSCVTGLLLPAIRSTLLPYLPRAGSIGMTGSVLAIGALVALAVLLPAGLVPAWRATHTGIREGLRRRFGVRSFVVGQLTAATVLVLGTFFLTSSFGRLLDRPLGFDGTDVLSFRVDLPSSEYSTAESVSGFFREVEEELLDLPEINTVGAVRKRPFADEIGRWEVRLEPEYDRGEGLLRLAEWQVVTPGYFSVLGVAVTEGRPWTETIGRRARPRLWSTALSPKSFGPESPRSDGRW